MTRFYTKQMMKAYVVGSGHIFGHSRQVVIYSHTFHYGTEGLSRKLVPCTPRSRYISRHLINLQNIVFGYIKILNVISIIRIIIFQMKIFWLYIFAYIYFVNFVCHDIYISFYNSYLTFVTNFSVPKISGGADTFRFTP